jgi:C4-type Zn-finger protein
MNIFADGLTKVSLSNNNLRITLVQNGPDNAQLDAGTLIIPANMAAGFVNQLAGALKKLDEQIKAQKEAQDVQVETSPDEENKLN